MPSDELGQGDREVTYFLTKLSVAATFQGRFSFLLMSIHATNPDLLASITDYDPHQILFANMLYGISVMILTRPHMSMINPINRLSFSVLGSCMFNYSAIMFFTWLRETLTDRRVVATVLGFVSGRIMMVNLLAYLYHVDTRMMIPGIRVTRDPTYESIYTD